MNDHSIGPRVGTSFVWRSSDWRSVACWRAGGQTSLFGVHDDMEAGMDASVTKPTTVYQLLGAVATSLLYVLPPASPQAKVMRLVDMFFGRDFFRNIRSGRVCTHVACTSFLDNAAHELLFVVCAMGEGDRQNGDEVATDPLLRAALRDLYWYMALCERGSFSPVASVSSALFLYEQPCRSPAPHVHTCCQ